MPSPPLTDKQRYWLEHIHAADISGDSIAAYANKHGLASKSLYAWKTRLLKLGVYHPTNAGGFTSVRNAELVSPVMDSATESPRCRVTLPSGARVEFMGELSPATIRSIITLASGAR